MGHHYYRIKGTGQAHLYDPAERKTLCGIPTRPVELGAGVDPRQFDQLCQPCKTVLRKMR